MIYIFLSIVVVIIIATLVFLQHPLFGKSASGDRLARMQQSKHFKNGQFHNLTNTPAFAEDVTYFDALKEFLFNKTPNTKPLDSIPVVHTNLKEIKDTEDYIVWFGHSSYLMQMDQQKILVDPVLTNNASPIKGTNTTFLGTDYYTAEMIPLIDYLILTHDHYDHLDYTTFKNIKDKVSKIVCPLGVGAHLEYWGFPKENIIEMDWNESTVLNDNLEIHCTPSRHFSGRSFKRNTTLWASFVLKSTSKTIYIGGDSGYDSHFKSIGNEFGPFDLVLLENGQYDHKWKYIHMLPNEVVEAAKDLQAKSVFPVHSSKFKLANHAWKEPLEKVYEAAQKDSTFHLVLPKIGELIKLDSLPKPQPWWENIK